MFTVIFGPTAGCDPFYDHRDSKLLGTIPLIKDREMVKVHSHAVDATLAAQWMLGSLAGFIENLWHDETSTLEPFDDEAVLVGFSSDPSGAEVMTECPVRSLRDAWLVNSGDVAPTPQQAGFFEVEVVAPRDVFAALDIDPATQPELARKLSIPGVSRR